MVKCENGNVIFRHNNTEFICSYSGEIVVIDEDFKVECPDMREFCLLFNERCPLDCSGNGLCLSNYKCFCFEGYEGEDCVKIN